MTTTTAIENISPQTLPTNEAFWVTIYATEDRAYPMPHTEQELERLFFASPFPHPVILARTKACPAGYAYELGDVESVSAIAIEIFNDVRGPDVVVRHGPPWATRAEWRRGEPEPRPTSTSPRPAAPSLINSAEDVQLALPFRGITYTAYDNRQTEGPRAMAVLFLRRPHSLEEAHRLREYLREMVWTSPQVGFVEFNEPIDTPAEPQWCWLPYWRKALVGSSLDVSMVPPNFSPTRQFVAPPLTNDVKRKLRLARVAKRAAELPFLLELLCRSDLALMLRRKPELATGLELHLASNVAPLLRELRFDKPTQKDAIALARMKLAEWVPDRPEWETGVSAALNTALAWMVDDPAPWSAYPETLRSTAGPTPNLLGDVLWRASRAALGQDRWLYIARENKWYLRDDTGAIRDDEPLLPEAARQRLRKFLSNKKIVDQFLDGADQVAMRDAVFSSTADIVVVDGLEVYNMYRPSTVTPRRGAYPDIEALIRNVVGKERTDEAYAFVFMWIAAIVQGLRRGVPWKWLTYLLLQGIPGSGKSFLIRILRELIGAANVTIADQARMESQFTPVARNTLLFVGNEIHASERKDRAIADNIKRIVTDETIMVERKFEQAREMLNQHMNFIMTTNDARPIHLAADDRRASVFRSSVRLPAEVASGLARDLAGDRQQLRGFLFDLIQTAVRLEKDELFVTDARQALIGRSMTKLDGFLTRLRDEGYGVLFGEYAASTSAPEQENLTLPDRNVVVPVSTMLAVAQYHCPASRGHELTNEALAAAIKVAFPSASNETRARVKPSANPTKHWTGIPYVFDEDGGCVMRAGDTVPPPKPKP